MDPAGETGRKDDALDTLEEDGDRHHPGEPGCLRAEIGLQTGSHPDKQGIAAGMAQAVVDQFEPVNIDVENGKSGVVAPAKRAIASLRRSIRASDWGDS